MSLGAALSALAPGARWHLRGDDLSGLQWLEDDILQPGEAAISEKRAEIEAATAVEPYRLAIQAHIDATASLRGYDNGASCAGYATSTIPSWEAEALAFISWRDAVWVYVYAELAKVRNGVRPQPTIEVLLGELEPMAWP